MNNEKSRVVMAVSPDSIEHDGPAAVQKDTFLENELQRLREHDLLDVASRLRHLFGPVAVIDGDDRLGDDRAFVELFGHEMRGGADDFHAAFEGLPVRVRAGERRQERMMNVDDALRIPADEFAVSTRMYFASTR